MNKQISLVAGVVVVTSLTLMPAAIAAEGGEWLDSAAITNWNTPGADVPTAPPQQGTNFEFCQNAIRAAQVPEDELLEAAGWTLFGPIQIFGDTTIVTGMANADGMCRPIDHQAFVFVDGQFAGTLAPTAMFSRTDGNLYQINLFRPDFLSGTYSRYQSTDPLCCPSSTSSLFFSIQEENGLPVLVPETTATTGEP